MQACTNGTLADVDVKWKNGAACCVIVASKGYPSKYESGFPMELPADSPDQFIYVAGAKRDGERLLSAGGRVLGVTATADTLGEAIEKAYAHTSLVKFENGFCRSDIGKRAMAALSDKN